MIGAACAACAIFAFAAPFAALKASAPAALKTPCRDCCRAIASMTSFMNGAFLEPPTCCLASLTLATRSAIMSRIPLPIIAADALVTIAMAEPVTAAYICQFPAPRFSASLKEDERIVAK
jgi:hypothetical protein